ncbi:DUF3618 domain-containing protein [Streptomyces bambusae]|uniref:DUF3618 domain-containing protein n=1 Tax=Streptomyces bambusae TaxID=1550616 RepID=UPI001CFDC993|nr:DUF3618 domain-containing protein [Streptomyces bambusae]MCB5164554.1 DUF3618 domain-containing protein [Streptomyces bambusae]
MDHHRQEEESAPATERLRDQVEHTRDELGRTVEALAAKARDGVTHAGHLAAVKAPDPVREKAGAVAKTARANRTRLVAGAAVLVVYLFLRRGRRHT